LFSLKIWLI